MTDPVLTRFRAALEETYGQRLARVVLYGSRARRDHRDDSDYDVAVFLHDMPLRTDEIRVLSDIETDILYDIGFVINALPFRDGAERERSGFMNALRRDGIDL
jgi:predicted nucleotidyltransferase